MLQAAVEWCAMHPAESLVESASWATMQSFGDRRLVDEALVPFDPQEAERVRFERTETCHVTVQTR
ncbi:hypothetical protein G6553_17295 [Nocardioides sp. IC4_145]|uniref:hypothetical protein n=1 Tax=Nocardioides sp. IC4_145 TaxID=2714037 RepID=UPI001408F0C2|nr:hypothetical protein [Nocardioides sp. IC4_145]NHC24926.1 hypothetical protein [Nocardioides sp. IC4_145]